MIFPRQWWQLPLWSNNKDLHWVASWLLPPSWPMFHQAYGPLFWWKFSQTHLRKSGFVHLHFADPHLHPIHIGKDIVYKKSIGRHIFRPFRPQFYSFHVIHLALKVRQRCKEVILIYICATNICTPQLHHVTLVIHKGSHHFERTPRSDLY